MKTIYRNCELEAKPREMRFCYDIDYQGEVVGFEFTMPPSKWDERYDTDYRKVAEEMYQNIVSLFFKSCDVKDVTILTPESYDKMYPFTDEQEQDEYDVSSYPIKAGMSAYNDEAELL